MIEAARQLEKRKTAGFMRDLVNIVMAPTQREEFLDSLRSYWRTQFENAVPEYKPDRVKIEGDGTPYLPWQQASQLMLQQMRVFKKVNGGG